MIECPQCRRTERQNQVGKTGSGSQRYRCLFGHIKYTPERKPWAYPEEIRRKAVELYVDGMSLRRIAQHLGVHHCTVSLWVKAHPEQIPDRSVLARVEKVERDERFTFVGDKKQQIFIILVDRLTRPFLGFRVVWQRSQEVIQEMVDKAPKARYYDSDAFEGYERLAGVSRREVCRLPGQDRYLLGRRE